MSSEEKDEVKELINAFALSNRIYLLADKDGENKKSKHTFLQSLAKDNDNFSYQHTGAIEIENMLSYSILKKVLVEVLNQNSLAVDSIQKITEKDYENVRLGEFFKKRINTRKDINLPMVSDNNKTLNSRYKLKISNYVYDEVLAGNITWEMICQNKNAKKITIEVFKFIEQFREKK